MSISKLFLVLRRYASGIRRSLSKSRELTRLRQFSHPRAPVLADILESWRRRGPLGNPLIEAIERQRSLWLRTDGVNAEADAIFDDKHTIARACQASKPPVWAELLYRLVYECKGQNILELGTNLGISSAYLSAAASPHGGSVITMEGSESRLLLAKKLHADLGLKNVDYVLGRFQKTLPDLLKQSREFDFAFIDGHHQFKPTLDYLDQIYPHLVDGAIVVFDDINWSDGMVEAWRKLQRDPRFVFVLDIVSVGIAVVRKNPDNKVPEVFCFDRPSRISLEMS